METRTHEQIMAKIWAEIERDRLAELERLYSPPVPAVVKKAEPPAFTEWHAVEPGVEEMSIEPAGGGLRIHGIATSPAVTTRNAVTDPLGMNARLPVPLLSSHNDKGAAPIGEVYFIRRCSRLVYIRARLLDHLAADYAAKQIRAGEVRCLSIAHAPGSRLLSVVDDVKFYDQWTLKEVSICPQGANPDARFEILREGDDGRKFFDASKADDDVPDLPYRGTWEPERKYLPGDFVTKSGSLWHSQITSQGLEPGKSPLGWKLCVKRGQAERLKAR